MSFLIPWIRATILLAWLLSPPVLTIFALVAWRCKRHPGSWKTTAALAIGTVVLTNWIFFLYFLFNGQTIYGYEYHTSRATDTLLLISFLMLIASIAVYVGRWQLLLANILLVTLWIGIIYSQAHWLGRVDFGEVKVDDRSVPAVVYIGYPADSEAQAIALVHVPTVGDYFLDFEEETFRQGSGRDFIPLGYGAWTYKPMRQGQFRPPLPFLHVNECRIPVTDGHILTVAF